MKIYRNGYVPDYERYFFFLHGRCIELLITYIMTRAVVQCFQNKEDVYAWQW